MKKRSIYQQQSQELMRIYEEAGNSKKVLVGAIDYAKKDHVVMLCNGNGDILRKPFTAKNTPEGVDYLIGQNDPREGKFQQAIEVEKIKVPMNNVEQLAFVF